MSTSNDLSISVGSVGLAILMTYPLRKLGRHRHVKMANGCFAYCLFGFLFVCCLIDICLVNCGNIVQSRCALLGILQLPEPAADGTVVRGVVPLELAAVKRKRRSVLMHYFGWDCSLVSPHSHSYSLPDMPPVPPVDSRSPISGSLYPFARRRARSSKSTRTQPPGGRPTWWWLFARNPALN